jgi:ferredoxin-NADP reductase
MNAAKSAPAALAFSVFIYVCGQGEHVSPLDAKRFGELMADPRWARSAAMRRGLGHLRKEYVNLWKAYRDAGNPLDDAALRACWLAACEGYSDEAISDLFHDIIKLASEFREGDGTGEKPRNKVADALEKVLGNTQAESEITDRTSQTVTAPPVEPIKLPDRNEHWWFKGSIKLCCVGVTQETHDVKSFQFRSVDGRRFCYKPGQAAVFHVPIDGNIIKRTYSLSSSPSRPDRLAITVKRVERGMVSSWLHDNVKLGTELEIAGPFGKLSCVNHPSEKILMLSAGSGVTPMISMLRYLQDMCASTDIVFLNNVRSPRDIIFGHELNAMASAMYPHLTLAIVPSARLEGTIWNGATGNICENLLRTLVPDCADREVFCCGPDGYRDVVRKALGSMGHPVQRYHEEVFRNAGTRIAASPTPANESEETKVPPRASLTPATVEARPQKYKILFAKSGRSVSCSADESILEVAERAGIPLDSSCRIGACGTCKIKTLQGSAVMEDFGILGDDEVADGFVLACSARAAGDIVVDC